ncbi:Melanotransferrin [Holothuria leucospilota]|uniref:Melanotransferrin n=1 Tax=Holothuria leucospilota TaxID=206669 RepID=A0A9Q1H2J1_HOLLE|nr:Melanotransferrin [Holothuria leucospilota]
MFYHLWFSFFTCKGVSHSVMTSGSTSMEDVQAYQRLLSAAVTLFAEDDNPQFTMFDSSAWGGRNLIFKDYAENMEALPDQTYAEYLGGFGESFEGLHKCPDNTLRICTISEQEQQKCREMRDVFLEAGLTPEISCFPTTSHADCIDSIAAGFADIVTLDGGDIYRAGKDHGLIPILGEVYGDTKQTISYWAVAVVKKGTSFSIEELQGKRSCHTGIMKTSGWVMPVGFLATEGYLDVSGTDETCEVTRAVGMFFNSSCAPGAKSAKYDIYGSNPESLCENCIGKDDDHCARNSHEPYYDYSGAFRCLVEDAGDVAFVKHSTVRDNTRPRGEDDWNRRLRQKDFEILCPDGTRTNPWKFRKCNLGKVSSHAVVTSKNKTDEEIKSIIDLFKAATERFKNETGDGFKIFDSSGFIKNGRMFHYLDSDGQLGKNLIFKDSTVDLRPVSLEKRSYDKWLGRSYLDALETIQCIRSS